MKTILTGAAARDPTDTRIIGRCRRRAGFRAAIDLLALNVAKSLGDLSPLKSVGLHKLKGDRKKQSATTVNERWRICFEFHKSDAHEVEIVDYHKG